MNLADVDIRVTLCCLHYAHTLIKKHNITSDKYFMVTKACFIQNTTTPNGIATFTTNYNQHINAKICSSLLSIQPDICNVPTSRGNAIYTVFLFLLMALILATNIFYCLAMFHSRNLLRHPSHRFILSLAVSDLLVALVAMPIIIDFTLHNQAFCSSIELCHLAYFVDHLVFISLILTLLAIGVDRFITVAKPYRYGQLMSPARSKFIIVSVWILSCSFGITANVDWGSMTFQGVEINQDKICFTRNPRFTGAILVTCFFVPVVIMGFLYYRIFRETLKHAKPIATIGKIYDEDDIDADESSTDTSSKRASGMLTFTIGKNRAERPRQQYFSCFSSAKLRVLRVVIIIYGTFVLCWLPGIMITLLNLFSPGLITLDLWLYHLLNEILPLSNSAINVFIYAVMNEDCKRAMQKLLTCGPIQRHIERKRFEREKKRRESEKSVVLTSRYTEV
ncbi:beta-1 adrenergic receptor-like [Rhopilema esculentum]|uniref:beta-1 adrenergic receptor-like n=1 Tax=Rhopilema esculentum TaxID=499914 RepID=UPI0031DB280E|eukprot:gene10264-18958_t